MTKCDCCHKFKDGESAIKFANKNKWTGVYPKKIQGICSICKNQITFTENEYKEFIKEGESL